MSVNMTLALPDDLHEKLRRHPEVKWADVARRAFQQEIDKIEVLDMLLADSKMTDEKAVAWGRRIRHGAAKRSAASRAAHARKPKDRGGAEA
ncbi:MAG: hypothetical protein ACYDCK_00955 [Thermoplasmatota archaeon]